MPTQHQAPSTFAQRVDHLTGMLTDSTRLAAAAHRQAYEAEAADGARAFLNRILGARAPQEHARPAEVQLRRYGQRLRELHDGLEPLPRAQLERDIALICDALPKVNEEADTKLADAARRPRDDNATQARKIGDTLRVRVHQAVGVFTPPDAAPRHATVKSPPDSLLPPAAVAWVRGGADEERIVDHIDRRTDRWWTEMTKRHGLETMMPYLRQQASDPLEVVRVASWLAQGVVLGTKLDPATREPRGQAVVEPTHTAVVIGASGIGKTTGLVAPYAALRASVGDNVVVVTPQPPTIGLILPTAKALSGQDHVPVIDFGGEIVGRESPEFRAWDVTRNCLDVERAMEFADSFAGPKVPAREHLTNPEYWGGMVWDMYAAAGHIAAGMRELQGLDPHGLNGMARVYDLLRSSRAEDLRTKLHAELQAALEGSPAQLRRQEALVQAATEHAERFHPRLQRIAFNEYMLREAGVPLSDEIVGETLESLNEALGEIAKARSGDPMESLLKSFKRAVPLRERLVMSPRPGDNEIDPSDLVRPGAGISFVAYAHRGSTGLAAGAFTSQVLDAAMSRSKDAGMLRSIGGQGVDARLSLVVDEGGAGRHIPRLPDVVTDARQGGISALVSMTSEHHLRSVFGDEDAGKFLHAPCVIDMSPDPDRAADIAQLFGDHVVERRSESSGVGVGSVTWSEQKEDLLGAADVTRIPRGHAWVSYPSDPEGDRVKLVELPQFKDPSTLVGAAAEYVEQHPEEFEPMRAVLERFRPDLVRTRSLQSDPTGALLEGSEELVAAALADPAEEPDDLVEVPPQPATEAPTEPEPPVTPVEAEPELETPAEPVEPEPAEPVEPEPEPPAPPVTPWVMPPPMLDEL